MEETESKIMEIANRIERECRGHKVSAGILCDAQIRWRAREQDMISPFLVHGIREYGVSAGVTHHGYDARLGNVFKTFRKPIRRQREWCTTKAKLIRDISRECIKINDSRFLDDQIKTAFGDIIEPGVTELTEDDFVIDEINDPGDAYILYPQSAVLAHTVEYFRIPNDIHCTVMGKSTLARLFVHPMVTPLEAGWHGQVTLEVANLGARPVMLRPGMGIIQVSFHAVDPPDESYEDKAGKYQGQTGVRVAKW